ncbi:MAG TPA: tripartite tricarboxylate transporter TctB family protein [Burkholderiaceae bacterium]|nr:tripartite tricarboxylate transporter TctB family protein [Burkholderiaceae bacterium]
MQRIDRWLGLALALLGGVVLWTSRAFPAVPGQKLGAGFLPALVGAGLAVAGLALFWRSRREAAAPPRADAGGQRVAPLAVIGVSLFYLLAADKLGFLIVAPLGLGVLLRAFGVGWRATVLWAVAGTIVVHLAFYKMLRVPLPWGVLRPFY